MQRCQIKTKDRSHPLGKHEFASYGEAIYGTRWQKPMGIALGKLRPGKKPYDPSLIRKWASGRQKTPAWLSVAVAVLLRDRRDYFNDAISFMNEARHVDSETQKLIADGCKFDELVSIKLLGAGTPADKPEMRSKICTQNPVRLKNH